MATGDRQTVIHPVAVVHPEAVIGNGVTIGPWVLIEAGAKIGDNCRIDANAQILNAVTLGANCVVCAGAVIGGDPQDTKFDHLTPSQVTIGDDNVFRENTTVHRSASENGVTKIGNRNYLMAGAHVGHDSIVGDDNVLANNCLLGGHVELGNKTFLGGGSAFHQFVRVGDLCMVKGLSAISRDVPPFVTASGVNQISGLNVVGMRRSGFSDATRKSVKAAFNHMFRSGLNLTQALEAAGQLELESEARHFIEFFEGLSKKGICKR